MTEQTEQMIRYITVEIMRRSDVQIDETTPLVSSGLIDPLALVDIVMKLEDVTHTRLPAGKIQAKDMDTVQLMFATAARVGKPRR